MKDKKTDLILNMDEKIYLAVAKESTEKFAFVFTLACLRQGKSTSYDLNATRVKCTLFVITILRNFIMLQLKKL